MAKVLGASFLIAVKRLFITNAVVGSFQLFNTVRALKGRVVAATLQTGVLKPACSKT